jgi:O-antigen ligase
VTRAAELVATYGLAAIVLTLPLEFTSVPLRQPLSRFVMLVVGLAFAYLVVVRRRTISVPRFLSTWLLLLVVLASLASWALTRTPQSTRSLLDISLYPIVALMIVNLPLSGRDHRRAWIAFLVSGVGVALTGLVLYMTGLHIWSPNPLVSNRVNVTFADPNITARFLTLAACSAILMYSARKSPWWLAIATAVSCAVVLPMTWSRSGLALIVISALVTIALALDRRRAGAIAGVALLAFVLSVTINPDTRARAVGAVGTMVTAVTGGPVDSASAIPGDQDVSLADNRVYLVKAGWQMFVDHPVGGVGFGGYQHAMLTTYRSFLPPGYTDAVSHTSLVTVLAEQGVIGIVLLVLFLLALAREALVARARNDRWAFWSTLPATLIIPIFLYSQFEARFFQEPYLWFLLGMYYSARMLAAREAAREPALDPSGETAAAAA